MRVFIVAATFLVSASLAHAAIVDWNCDDDGDGAIVMEDLLTEMIDDGAEYTLSLQGTQYGYPAHVEGDFITDTPLDPIVWIVETVENQTTFDWTGYHIDFGMNQTFAITSVIAPLGWTYSVTQPVPGTLPNNNGSGYLGAVDYTYGGPGTEIAVGESGDFGLKVQFDGTVAFCTEQTPVPEPASLSLLVLGGLAFVRRRWAY